MVELDVAFAAVSILAVVTVAFLLRACSGGATPPRQREELGRQTAVADVAVVDIEAGLDDADQDGVRRGGGGGRQGDRRC
jgi:hypothetical protein